MRMIMHIDMDAFFAAVEERERPELRGKPIVVGADPKGGHGRGVVSTANYEARNYGIHSAMPISQAWKLCPSPPAAYLPVDGALYGIVSERIMKLVRECVERYAEAEPPSRPRLGLPILIEQVSIDETYVDVSFCGSYAKARTLARRIKRTILQQERLTCSVGIGPNKLIAKIASDFKKPNGLVAVKPEEVRAFLDPMPVRTLPGIGPKTEAQLARRGIETVHDLWLASPPQSDLGCLASGFDEAPVIEAYEAKSLGRDTTFDRDTRDQALLMRTILALADEVMQEVAREHALFRTITVRVRFDNFETHTSSHTLRSATQHDTILKREALRLLFPYFKGRRLIRLIGVRVSKLEERR